jgi:predicted O-methyltransferase YrrM
MGFYDNWNFDGLKFFSQIKDKPECYISEPCGEFLTILNQLKSNSSRNIKVAEIGIGFGATALPILLMLGEEDEYFCFDFSDKLQDFANDLQTRDFGIKCQITLAGNSHYKWDSYNWNLSNLVFQMRGHNQIGIFDAVYLDGAHTFLYDGLAVCLLKELVKEGGFLVLDDLFWTADDHHYVDYLPKEQRYECQIFRAQELFLANDPNWEKLSSPKDYRGVFRKRSRSTKQEEKLT